MPILEVKNLTKRYPKVLAVNDVTFSIERGKCLGLLGPNGAGKTTTIEIMEGITPADSGEILYAGKPIGKKFKQEAGIQFQSTSLQEFLTVKETLQLFKKLYHTTVELDHLIETCALAEFLHRDNRQLSGGQRQRLLLAIALVNDPKIVFLDEPTTGLDPQARRNFWHLVEKIKAENKTIVLTTHYMEEAAILCDNIIIMDKGCIIAEGSPEELLRNHFTDVLLQLPEDDFLDASTDTSLNITRDDGKVTIHSNNVHDTIQSLNNLEVNLARLQIHTPNLEDLFLELTGKDLRS